MKCLVSVSCLPVPQDEAPGRQFPPEWELLLFSGHPLQGWKSSTSAWNIRDLLEMLNLLQGFLSLSRLLWVASRVRSPVRLSMPSWPCSSWPPAALSLPELWPFPSLRPSPAPLSGRISGPHHHPAPGPPSRPPFLLPPSFPPFLPLSLPPSSCTRKQPDPGSGLTREIPNLAGRRGWRLAEGGGEGGAGPLGCTGGSGSRDGVGRKPLALGFPGGQSLNMDSATQLVERWGQGPVPGSCNPSPSQPRP